MESKSNRRIELVGLCTIVVVGTGILFAMIWAFSMPGIRFLIGASR